MLVKRGETALVGVLNAHLLQPCAMIIVAADGTFLVGLLLFLHSLAFDIRHDGPLNRKDAILIFLCLLCTTYAFLREVLQAGGIYRIGKEKKIERLSLSSFLFDGWNIMDVLMVVIVAVVCFMAIDEELRNLFGFSVVMAFAGLLAWFKLLSFLKGMNMKFAMYVLCLFQIMLDIRQFFMIIIIAVSAITFFVYMVWTGAEGLSDVHLEYVETLVSVWRLLLGDFGEKYDFANFGSGEGPLPKDWFILICFVTFTIIGLVLMLNILIAVVSDSYEHAQINARPLFLLARISLVAELDSMGLSSTSLTKDGRPATFCSRVNRHFGRYMPGKGAAALASRDDSGVKMATPRQDGQGAEGVLTEVDVMKADIKRWQWASFLLRRFFHILASTLMVSRKETVSNDDDGELCDDVWLGRSLDLERRIESKLRKQIIALELRVQKAVRDHVIDGEDRLAERIVEKMEAIKNGGSTKSGTSPSSRRSPTPTAEKHKARTVGGGEATEVEEVDLSQS